jgi:hypothetical protein
MFLHQAEQLAPDERAAQLDEFRALMTEIAQSGELIDTAALGDPATGRVIRFRDGVPAATDGPFADSKEQMAGYFVVDCVSFDRATEIAARFPDARHGGVEVRPLRDGDVILGRPVAVADAGRAGRPGAALRVSRRL